MITKDKKSAKIETVYYDGKSYSSFVLNHLHKLGNTDFLIFNFDILPLIDFEKELCHQTKILSELAKLSKHLSCYVIAAGDIKTDEKEERAALVFEQGKLLTVIQFISSKTKSGGACVNFFDTAFGRVAIFLLDNAAQVEFYQLAHVYGVNIVFALPQKQEYKKHMNICAVYANERLGLNIVCFSGKQVKSFCSEKKNKSGQALIRSVHYLKNSARISSFSKHIHKSIYSRLE